MYSAKDDEFLEPITNEEIPQSLQIKELIGIKLENTIVTDRVAMNVKLPLDGKYRIKIRHGINNELISQEMIDAEEPPEDNEPKPLFPEKEVVVNDLDKEEDNG